MLAGDDVETGGGHGLAEVPRIVFQLVSQCRSAAQHFQHFNTAPHYGWRQGVGKQVRPGALTQHLHDLLAGSGEAAGCAAEGLAVGAGDDVHPVHHVAVFVGAAAGFAEEAGGMAFVYHHHGVVAVGEVAYFIQLGDGAVHGEGAVGGNEAAAGRGGLFELFLQVVHVVVLVAEALGFAQANAVDDGGVVEFVGDDGVFLAQYRFEEASVGVECSSIEDAVLHAEELGGFALQLLVYVLRAADKSHRGHAEAVGANGFNGGFYHFRVGREAKVIIGTEVEHFLALVGGDFRALRRDDNAFHFEQAGVAYFLKLVFQSEFYSSEHVDVVLCRAKIKVKGQSGGYLLTRLRVPAYFTLIIQLLA